MTEDKIISMNDIEEEPRITHELHHVFIKDGEFYLSKEDAKLGRNALCNRLDSAMALLSKVAYTLKDVQKYKDLEDEIENFLKKVLTNE